MWRRKLRDILRTLVSLCFLAGAMTARIADAQGTDRGYEPPDYRDGKAHYERRERSFGNFTVVRYVEDCRDLPLLDVGCWLTKESQLEWRDSTGMIGFTFVDNGASVRFKPMGKSADGRTICLSQGVLVGYDPKPSTLEHWQKLQPFIRPQLRACTAIAASDLDRAMVEMQSSGADYVAAARAWKGVSVELFGSSGRRCTADRLVKPVTMPPRYECARYSRP